MKEALAFVFPAWYYFAAGMVDGARLSLIWHESGILVRIIWCKWEALQGRVKVAIAVFIPIKTYTRSFGGSVSVRLEVHIVVVEATNQMYRQV